MKIISAFLLLPFLTVPLLAQVQPLTTESSTLFSGPGNCESCHSSGGAVLNLNGLDVSMITHWRGTMMANAAEDPLWRAKVSAEIDEHPALTSVIETKCTGCHAPMGKHQSEFDGVDTFSVDEMEASALALGGVSCTVCHQIQPGNFGTKPSYSGGYTITDTGILWGPYDVSKKMAGYDATYGAHIDDAELCATCHMLFTPFVDDAGAVAGEFAEQTPYYEWLNSSLSPATTCQSCHMPSTTTAVKIASGGGTYSPFWFHHFVGGNVFNAGILRDNADSLQLSSGTEFFDSTIARTKNHLRTNAVTLSAACTATDSQLTVRVAVQNRAGHKLPTGIPIRRVWLNLAVADSNGAVVWQSGAWDADGNITGRDNPYEPHHNVITDAGQVQIYEGVMQDINNAVTYTLLRAASYVKDNRIPPAGFTTAHAKYDTVAVFGAAAADPNFNIDGGAEGSGTDTVTYVIRLNDAQRYTVRTKLCYQSVAPAFAAHLLAFGTDEVNEFAPMYAGQSKAPFIIDSVDTQIDVPVPVVISSFTATLGAGGVQVAWTTESETDNLGWYVQRAPQAAGPFVTVSGLIPGQGTTGLPHSYEYVDPSPPTGTSWYRVQQQNIDGTTGYSKATAVSVPVTAVGMPAATGSGLFSFGNPARTVSFNLATDDVLSITLFSTDGSARRIMNGTRLAAGTHTVTVPRSVANGVYLVRFDGAAFSATGRLIILK